MLIIWCNKSQNCEINPQYNFNSENADRFVSMYMVLENIERLKGKNINILKDQTKITLNENNIKVEGWEIKRNKAI